MPPLITLTTDFGLSDIYVGVMKGVLFQICPNANVIDLTHNVAPHDILGASLCLEAAVPYLPPGAIHVVVVDPGVGSDRAAIIVRTETSHFVCPDNGVLTLPLLIQPAAEAIKITDAVSPYLRHPVSATFHGRDVFAPIAAHLANGTPLSSFGRPCAPSELVTIPMPSIEITGAQGKLELTVPIVAIDHFGNLVTALHKDALDSICERGGSNVPDAAHVHFAVNRASWAGISATFASVPVGAPVAYWGSGGRLEVAVRNGSAAAWMGASVGDSLHIDWSFE